MKILIVGPAWVGDMVLAQTLFMLLRTRHADCRLDVLAPAWTAPLLERMPQVRRALPMPLGHGQLGLGARWRLGRSLRGEGYDQAIVLPNSLKSALVPLAARIPRRTGWRGEMRYGLLNDCRVLDQARYALMVERFAALALPPGEPLPALPWPVLAVGAERRDAVRRRFSLQGAAPVLALCPGAEFGPSKQGPARHYAQVAQRAIGGGGEVWLMGSPKDRAAAQEILARLDERQRRRCRDFTGHTSLGEAIDLLSLAGAVVSNDSGLMHIAAALQRPLVVVYGSSSPLFTPPLASGVRILSRGLACSPCFARECPLGHHRCMRELAPEQVLKALAALRYPALQGP